MLFDNINTDHIAEAVVIFEEKGPPTGLNQSNYYDVIIGEKRYPPKPIIAYANELATGKEPGNYFKGGENTPAFKALQRLGYKVVKKESQIDIRDTEGNLGISSKFKKLMEKVDRFLKENDSQLKLDPKHLGANYAWFNEKNGDINSTLAHFEVNRKGNDLWLWLHFEDKLTKKQFSEKIDRLPQGYSWEDWYDAKSIRKKTSFNLTEIPDAKDIMKELSEMQADLAPLVTPVINSLKKLNIKGVLTDFIKQASSGDLKTKHYPKTLGVYNIKVSFGQGGAAKIPWISILKKPNTTSRGIYPAYLFFKDQSILILAYGISETNEPDNTWNLSTKQTISQYFQERNYGKPDRYGASYVCKTYSPENLPKGSILDKDLQDLLEIYEQSINGSINELERDLSIFNQGDLERFIKHFGKIVNQFSLNVGDPRITYTLRNSRINVTVGQRYAWVLHRADNEKAFGLMTDEEISSESTAYRGSSHTNYYTDLLENEFSQKLMQSNLDAIALELNRTTSSSFRSANNDDLEQYLFDHIKSMEPNITSQNLILYGPPGTGKTYKLKEEFFPNYSVQETNLSEEEHFTEVVQDLSWFQVIALALIEEGRSKVQSIIENRWVKTKDSLSFSKNVRATVWGSLQTHTIRECEYVNYKSRTEPLLFNKDKNSYWELVDGSIEEQSPELLELKAKVDDFKANPDQEIKRYVFTTFHQAFSYEDFIEGIKPVMDQEEGNELSYRIEDGVFKKICKRATSDPQNQYAIFIDEINRGNIANIFGELITLIEPDKRLGMPAEMSVILPYSKQSFSVPANLDIIGTMNTADRSVEALDTALRRRFNFHEMLPQPKLLKSVLGDNAIFNDIDLEEVLRLINLRIEKLIDRDHSIGHAYFLKLKSRDDQKQALIEIFCDNIIPLLQEYFYNDYPKIGLVLGRGFIDVLNEEESQQAVKFADFEADGSEDYLERPLYRIKSKSELTKDDTLVSALKTLLG